MTPADDTFLPGEPGHPPGLGQDCRSSVAAELALLQDIRQAVGTDAFDGLAIERLVNASMYLLGRQGRLAPGGCRFTAAVGNLGRTLVHPRGLAAGLGLTRRHDLAALQGRTWIVALGVQDRVRKLWEPLARALGPDKCVLISPARKLLGKLPADLPQVALDEIPSRWWSTRAWVLTRLAHWRRGLRRIGAERGFAAAAHWQLAAALAEQVGTAAAALALARILQPRAAIVVWDQDPLGSAVCAAMKRVGRPSLTLVHGALGRQNLPYFAPILATHAVVWGELQKQMFQERGVPADRIVCAGLFDPRPAPAVLSVAEREARLRRLGAAPSSRHVVVVGLTCLRKPEHAAWGSLAQELSRLLPGSLILCRLHPSNDRASFAESLAEHDRLRILDDRMMSSAETLDLADAVVVDSSSLGFDALQRGLPVVVIDPPDGSGYFALMLEAVQAGAALYARDTAQLAAHLDHLRTDAPARSRLLDRARAFEAQYVSAYGTEALGRAGAALDRICDGPIPRRPLAAPLPLPSLGQRQP